jgi:general secretion pathway protein K
MRAPPENDRSGFVLVTVVWLAGLLALVAATFTGSVRHQTEAAASALAVARAEAVMAGALNYVSYRLQTAVSTSRQVEPWNGVAMRCVLPSGEAVVVRLQDQTGLVDLNLAELPLLQALLAGVGLEGEQAARLAEAIVDYRDGDEITAAGHPESEIHTGMGRGGALKNRAFETIYELDRVPGMPQAVLDVLLPWVTVHSPQGTIDRAAAPQALVIALSRAAPSLVTDDRYIAASPRTRVSIETAPPSRPGQALRAIVSLDGVVPRILLVEPVRRSAPASAQGTLC